MRQALLLTIVLVTLAGCGRNEVAPEPVRSVRTLTVADDSAGTVHEYAAEVRARTESRLGFRIGGKIVRRNVDLGSAVKAGDVLAQLDPQDMRLGRDAAQASLGAARANLEQTQADFKRFKELRDQGFISSAELERRQTALNTAQAQFDQARAQSNVQGNQAAYTALVADAAGVITGVEAEPGMVVAAGTPVIRLAHDGPRDVVFAVPEDRVALVKRLSTEPGHFSVRLWGDGSTLPATVREIAAAADPVTRTFTVKADIGVTRANGVRLGQTATVLVTTPRSTGVTKLPLSALKQEQGGTVVWVVDRATMTVAPQKVTVSGVDGNEAVIADGLQAGQVVVTAGVHVLNPGQKVKFYAGVDGSGTAPAAAQPASAAN